MINETQLLQVMTALADKCAAAGLNAPYVMPLPLLFENKSDFFAEAAPTKDTRAEIELSLLSAAWIDYLRFDDSERDTDAPIKTLIFEITLFHEDNTERKDEADNFGKQLGKARWEHLADITALMTEFQGVQPISLGADFATAETISLTQPENTRRNAGCDYVGGVTGSQTKFQCAVKLQTVAC